MCMLVYGTSSLALSPSSAVDHKNLTFDQLKREWIQVGATVDLQDPDPSIWVDWIKRYSIVAGHASRRRR